MPRNPIDYSKSMFYKLVCKDITITDLYVGFTTDLKTRKSAHKTACHNENTRKYNMYVYTFIREHGGFENWDMIVIHRQNCIDIHEAHTIERGYMESLGATLNSYMPIRTEAEWIEVRRQRYGESHKEEKTAYNLLYYETNKDKIKEQTAIYRDSHKEDAKNYQLLYNIANREKIKMQMKLYNEKNKDVIREKRKLAYEKKKLLKQESLGIIN
jgi:hypothetical protein